MAVLSFHSNTGLHIQDFQNAENPWI
uniref:Uncharacterized protein n=1 Tax=Pyricularia oryzae (strain P131) TaxID=1143193 RepID=L7IU07_PYRO1